MKKETNLTLGITEPNKVDQFLQNFDHPLIEVVNYLRKIFLETDPNIGESIYWNAPTFFYTGSLKPFESKEYKRYIAGFVLNKTDVMRMVFLHGANANDKTGLLEGNYSDGRRLAVFKSIEEVNNKEKALKSVIKKLINLME